MGTGWYLNIFTGIRGARFFTKETRIIFLPMAAVVWYNHLHDFLPVSSDTLPAAHDSLVPFGCRIQVYLLHDGFGTVQQLGFSV